MNVSTQVRRSSFASTLAAAALVIAACGADEAPPEASESTAEGAIELEVTPDLVTFKDAGAAEYIAEWKADAKANAGCEFVLSVTDPADQVIHSVPVTGCDSSMSMTLVDGAGDIESGEYTVELERDGERAEAEFAVAK